jgi:hypothetical protein
MRSSSGVSGAETSVVPADVLRQLKIWLPRRGAHNLNSLGSSDAEDGPYDLRISDQKWLPFCLSRVAGELGQVTDSQAAP